MVSFTGMGRGANLHFTPAKFYFFAPGKLILTQREIKRKVVVFVVFFLPLFIYCYVRSLDKNPFAESFINLSSITVAVPGTGSERWNRFHRCAEYLLLFTSAREMFAM